MSTIGALGTMGESTGLPEQLKTFIAGMHNGLPSSCWFRIVDDPSKDDPSKRRLPNQLKKMSLDLLCASCSVKVKRNTSFRSLCNNAQKLWSLLTCGTWANWNGCAWFSAWRTWKVSGASTVISATRQFIADKLNPRCMMGISEERHMGSSREKNNSHPKERQQWSSI